MRQRKALKILVENGGRSVSGAMRAAGYSPETAKSPQKLTKSKSWEKLLEKYLPDRLLTQKISEGLDANRVISAISGKQANGATSDFIEVPDHAVRHKFVETSLKIKGKLVERHELTGKDGKDLPAPTFQVLTPTAKTELEKLYTGDDAGPDSGDSQSSQ